MRPGVQTAQKLLGWSLLGLLVFILLLLAVFTWVIQTELGSRWAVATAKAYLPAELKLGAVTGTLASPLTLEDLQFEGPGLTLGIQRIEVHWQLFDLLDAAVTVEQLHASGIDVALRPTDEPPSTEPLALPRLPVTIDIAQLQVRDLRLVPAPDAETLELTALDAAARWNEEQLAIDSLRLRAPLIDLDGDLALGFPTLLEAPLFLRTGPITGAELEAANLLAAIEYTLRAGELEPVVGTLRSDGTLAALQIALDAQRPYGMALEGTVGALLSRPELDLALSIDSASLQQLSAQWPAVRIGARGQLEGTAGELTAWLKGESVAVAGPLANGNVRGALDVVYSPDRLRIVELSIQEQRPRSQPENATVGDPALATAAATLSAKGLIELGGPAATLDVAANWQHLRWPLVDPARLRSEGGTLTVLGTAADYQARLEAQLAVPNQSDGFLQAQGNGSQTAFQLRSLEMATLGGTISASGDVSWDNGVNAQAQWNVVELNPEGLVPDWPGSVGAQGSAVVSQAGADAPLNVTLHDVTVDGMLRDEPLSGAIAVQYQAPQLTINEAQLGLGNNALTLQGGIDTQQRYNLQFDLDADALQVLLPGSSGSLRAQGALTGPEAALALQLEASAADVRYQQRRLGTLNASGRLGIAPDYDNAFEVQIANLQDPSVSVDTASLSLRGPQTGHQLSLGLTSKLATIDLALAGQTDSLAKVIESDGAYRFELQRLDIARPELRPWQLEAPANATIATSAATLETLCLASAATRACIGGDWSGGSSGAAELQLDNLGLNRFNSLLPPELSLTGTLDGGGRIALEPRDEGTQLLADLKLRTSAVSVLSTEVADDNSETVVVGFQPGRIELTSAVDSPLELQLALPLDPVGGTAGGVEGQLQLTPDPAELDLSRLGGKVSARIADLSAVAELVPQVTSLSGSLTSEMQLDGTLAAPLATGYLRLENGEAALAGPGITVGNIQLEVVGDVSGESATGAPIPLTLQGSMESGKGTLTLDGDLRYTAAEMTGLITLSGERFQLLNNEQVELYFSPDLRIELAEQSLSLRGVIAVPEADIALQSLPESAVVVSDDQVIVGTDGDGPEELPYQYDAEITLSLGEAVRFEGFGLNAQFTGDLQVKQATDEPGLGRGEIRITEGRYQAYGQDLSIETGRAIWTNSPLDQPGLDLRAVRKPRPDIVVGVRARGRLSQPDFSLFSEPSMGESDQLSYLVLGRPLEDNSSAESSMLSQAALALGIRGGNFLSDQFGDRLGVDQIGVETEAGAGDSGAAFVVGKYLSPKLYVSYGLGLLDSVSTLKLEYLLSSKWRLVTESSTVDSGGDLIYTIERK